MSVIRVVRQLWLAKKASGFTIAGYREIGNVANHSGVTVIPQAARIPLLITVFEPEDIRFGETQFAHSHQLSPNRGLSPVVPVPGFGRVRARAPLRWARARTAHPMGRL